MPRIIIDHEHYGALTFETKTVSDAWEIGRVMMNANPEVKSIEVYKDDQ